VDDSATRKITSNPTAPEADEQDALREANARWRRGSWIAGRYLIVRRVGQGGMGVVAVAEDAFLRKTVAIKALRPNQATDPRNVERFRKEVALAHTVTHPNIVRIYDLGEDEGVHFFSMELLEGMALSDYLSREPRMEPQAVRRLAIKICNGLAAAHSAQIVHRDLKPSNIMLMKDKREVVILDFGISRALDEPYTPPTEDEVQQFERRDVSSWDVTSMGMGTPKYMSPEQWMRTPCGPSSDMYSLGAILFRCLTGRAPFVEETSEDYATAHLTEAAPSVRSLLPDVPADLDRVISRCLKKKAEQRYQSADEVLKDLTRPSQLAKLARLAARVVIVGLVLLGLSTGLVKLAEQAIIEEMRPAVRRLAELAAAQIDVQDLDQVRTTEDYDTETFRRVQQQLLRVHADNQDIKFIYTLRRQDDPLAPFHSILGIDYWEFVVDEDPVAEDMDGDGDIEGEELGAMPGQPYIAYDVPRMDECVTTGEPTADDTFLADQFAITLSGYAPVGDTLGPGGYILGVDVDNSRLATFRRIVFTLCLVAWPLLVVLPRLVEQVTRGRRRQDAPE